MELVLMRRQLQDVISDVKSLTGDDPSITADLAPAIEKYNKEQLISTMLPGAGGKLVRPSVSGRLRVNERADDVRRSLCRSLMGWGMGDSTIRRRIVLGLSIMFRRWVLGCGDGWGRANGAGNRKRRMSRAMCLNRRMPT